MLRDACLATPALPRVWRIAGVTVNGADFREEPFSSSRIRNREGKLFPPTHKGAGPLIATGLPAKPKGQQ